MHKHRIYNFDSRAIGAGGSHRHNWHRLAFTSPFVDEWYWTRDVGVEMDLPRASPGPRLLPVV